MKKIRIFAVFLAGLLGGCGSSAPVLLNPSPQGVVVRYDPALTTFADATAAAAKFCARYGREAVAGDGSAMTGDTFIPYHCQKP